MNASVSDDLLGTFDRVVSRGKDMPIEELKKRFMESKRFRVLPYKIYKTVIDIPLTVDMVTGHNAAVSKILDGLRELHGDELMYVLSGHGENVSLEVRMWQSDDMLRDAWKEYAEDEYKSEIHVNAA